MSKTEELNFLNDLIDQVLVIDKTKTICFANLNAKKRFGENILDQNISSIIRDPELLDNIQKSLNDKSSSTIDVETKKPNYQYYKVSVMPGPKNIFNAQETVIIFFKDFTDIIKVQKLKSDFVANVSHELRTPLQSIKMGLETINDGAAKNDKENQKKIMPLIMQQAARMENIVNDLLSLSRIELQEHIRPNDNVVLDEIIKHSVDLHKDLLQKNSITCKIETENKNTEFIVSPSHPRIVNGEPSENPRYLQDREDLHDDRSEYLAKVGMHLYREIPINQPIATPVNSVLPGRRNNPVSYTHLTLPTSDLV